MELKNQVISLEYAKELKELGYKQESLYVWQQSLGGAYDAGEYHFYGGFALIPRGRIQLNIEIYPAFTVAELGEMLPEGYVSEKIDNPWVMIKKDDSSGRIINKKMEVDKVRYYFDVVKSSMENTEANTRAKMLIYLLKNKLL